MNENKEALLKDFKEKKQISLSLAGMFEMFDIIPDSMDNNEEVVYDFLYNSQNYRPNMGIQLQTAISTKMFSKIIGCRYEDMVTGNSFYLQNELGREKVYLYFGQNPNSLTGVSKVIFSFANKVAQTDFNENDFITKEKCYNALQHAKNVNLTFYFK